MENASLMEGVDYYIENGCWVFTAHYLSKRGYCCKSGCRHCPYGFDKDEQRPATSVPGPAKPD